MRKVVPSIALACVLAASQANARCAVLTFDDGPNPSTTPGLLDTLKAKGVKATFFIVGTNAREWPDIVRRMHENGNDVGGHSWDHYKPFEALSRQRVAAEFAKTDAAIKAAIGVIPAFIRIPGGSRSKAIASALGSRPRIDWDVDPKDWERDHRNAGYVARYVLGHMSGPIVLLHDIRKTTVEAVPAIIDGLRARGYTFATVSEYRSGACGAVAAR